MAPLLPDAHGIYAIAERLGLEVGDPPVPVRRLGAEVVAEVEEALNRIAAASWALAP